MQQSGHDTQWHDQTMIVVSRKDEVVLIIHCVLVLVLAIEVDEKRDDAPRDNRLVFDASVSGSNSAAIINERVRLPGVAVAEASAAVHVEAPIGLKLDIQATYKRVRVHPSQWRYLPF